MHFEEEEEENLPCDAATTNFEFRTPIHSMLFPKQRTMNANSVPYSVVILYRDA